MEKDVLIISDVGNHIGFPIHVVYSFICVGIHFECRDIAVKVEVNMKKPVFHHSEAAYTVSWILALPVLIDICTACTLFSFWLIWILYFLVVIVSVIRLVHGFRQKCYGFCLSILSVLTIGAAVLLFFQLSFNNVIQTPVSHPLSPADLSIENPVILADSAKLDGEYCPVGQDTVISPAKPSLHYKDSK